MDGSLPGKLLLFALVLLFSACAAKPSLTPTSTAGQTDVEEEAVYAFLLQKMYQHHGFVIMATTATGVTGVEETAQTLDYVLKNLHGVDPKTVASFRSRNDAAYPLRANMNLGDPYTLLTQAEKNQIFGQNQSGWDIFYNRFPQAPGITTLSRVGFNDAYDQALVYFGTQSNWLVGAGYYILLKKTNEAWSIDQKVMTWIS